MTTMRAFEYQGAGGPEVLVEVDRPKPAAGAGEVLIKVAAFGLNRADVQERRGVYPPPAGASDIPGLEVSGTIEALGEGALGFTVGQNVCALLAGGGYAQYVSVPAGHVLEVPENTDVVDAAGFMEVAGTVVSNLFLEANLAPGETVLLHGGAGGIGSMAIQLAVAAGAKVLVTASSAQKIEHCLALGATAGINYREEDFVERVAELTGGGSQIPRTESACHGRWRTTGGDRAAGRGHRGAQPRRTDGQACQSHWHHAASAATGAEIRNCCRGEVSCIAAARGRSAGAVDRSTFPLHRHPFGA